MSVFQRLLLHSVGLWIFIVPVVNSQTITSNLTGNQPVCPGEAISFTCVTRGSPTIEWTSKEYINSNGPGLQFNKFSRLKELQSAKENTNTIASLVKKTIDGGIDVLVSQLHIVILSKFPKASVTCVHGSGSKRVESFQVLDDPDMPQNMVADQWSDQHGSCTIHASWNAPKNINVTDVIEYMMDINGTNIKNETNTNNKNLIMTSYRVYVCATYHVSVKAVNRCGHAGRSTNVTLDPPSRQLPQQDCDDIVYSITQSTTDDITDAQAKSDSDDNTESDVQDKSGGDPCISVTVVITILLSVVNLLATTIVLAVLLKKQKDRSEDPLPTPTDSETKDSPL